MAAIKLVVELVSSDSDFVCIDDDHVAAHIHGWAIAWLIFASACTYELSTTTHMLLVSKGPYQDCLITYFSAQPGGIACEQEFRDHA